MSSPKRIVIVAGEASGDAHAAFLVRSLLNILPSLEISGIGGKQMKETGVELLMDLAVLSVTGFTEVLKHVVVISKAFTCIKSHLEKVNPDLLILVDYPGFNLRLLKFAKQKNIRTLYYISPQIWAWKPKRIHLIKKNVDKMAVILPFEKKIYEEAGVPVAFVGHPLLHRLASCDDKPSLKKELKLPLDKKIVALLPGSRRNEVEKLFPVMLEAASIVKNQYPDVHFVMPVASTLSEEIFEKYLKAYSLNYSLISGRAEEVMLVADCVAVASGTASLECALLERPMCIVYRASLLTYVIARRLMKVRYLGLCNLLQNQMIVPELLQDDFNVKELSKMLLRLLEDESLISGIKKNLSVLRESLSSKQADSTLHELVLEMLNVKNRIDQPVRAEEAL